MSVGHLYVFFQNVYYTSFFDPQCLAPSRHLNISEFEKGSLGGHLLPAPT